MKERKKNTNFTGSVSLRTRNSFVYAYMHACNAFTLAVELNWIELRFELIDGILNIKDVEMK